MRIMRDATEVPEALKLRGCAELFQAVWPDALSICILYFARGRQCDGPVRTVVFLP